jgi:hypothetical protein
MLPTLAVSLALSPFMTLRHARTPARRCSPGLAIIHPTHLPASLAIRAVRLRPHERVLVLLQLLGGERPVELARGAVEAVAAFKPRLAG